MKTLVLSSLALGLSGCSASLSIPAAPTVIDRGGGGSEIIAGAGSTEIIEKPATEPVNLETCYARARGFQGLVPIPCGLAQAVRP